MTEYKGYRLSLDNFNQVHVMNAGKGALPMCLRGVYTNAKFARQAIDGYLDSKGVKDGKAGSGS